jgi:small multidrug resistance family-3 protein
MRYVAGSPASLALFAWLLTLHPAQPPGECMQTYGGVYIAVALRWLSKVDDVALTSRGLAGAAVSLLGMRIIVWRG